MRGDVPLQALYQLLARARAVPCSGQIADMSYSEIAANSYIIIPGYEPSAAHPSSTSDPKRELDPMTMSFRKKVMLAAFPAALT
jgi:hypothetical protein